MRRFLLLILSVMVFALPMLSVSAQEDIALDATYTSPDGSVIFAYPQAWTLNTDAEWITLGNLPAEEILTATPATLADGQVLMIISTLEPPDIGLEAGTAAEDVIAAMTESLGATDAEIATEMLGEKATAYASWTNEENDVLLAAITVDVDLYVLVIATAKPGEMGDFEPTILGIGTSLQYFSPEQRLASMQEFVREVNDSIFETAAEPNTPYILLAPEGAPASTGYRTLVVVHGYGGRGLEMAIMFGQDARESNGLLIAPTFDYDNYTAEELSAQLIQLLEEVEADYPLDDRGIVLYGFSAGGTFASYFTGQHPDMVRGLIVEGTPEISQPPSLDYPIVYAYLYGDVDPYMSDLNIETVQMMRQNGYAVIGEVIPNTGHTITERGQELAIEALAN